MRLRPLLAIVLVFTLGPASAQLTQRAGEKLHPHMTRLLAERGPMKGWVFFADKALADEGARSIALAEAREQLSSRALERRRRGIDLAPWESSRAEGARIKPTPRSASP